MQTNEISDIKALLSLMEYPQKPAWLLAAMQDIHAEKGEITPEMGGLLCARFHADPPLFNTLLPLFPGRKNRALHTLQICRGAVCAAWPELHIPPRDDLAVAESYCMGLCHQAPVAKLDDNLIPQASEAAIRVAIRAQIGG